MTPRLLYVHMIRALIFFRFDSPQDRLLKASIFNMQGQLVMRFDQNVTQSSDQFKIPLVDMSQGSYVLELKEKEGCRSSTRFTRM